MSADSAIDDRALARQAQQGDDNAFAQLVEACSERLYHMLLQLCNGDAEMACELTQEAFVRAYERLAQFDGSSAFYTWLYRLARNRAIDVFKKKKPQACDPQDFNDNVTKDDPGAALEQNEMQVLVQEALHALPDDQREIILLRDFDGHDYQHIATLLEVAEGTVKSRLNRARKALRQQIESMSNADQLKGLMS